jgi:hypothetical protein
MLTFAAAASIALVSGCASNGRPAGVPPAQVGSYHFLEHVGTDLDLEGTLVVESDTVSIDASPGPCRYEREYSNSMAITYTCADVRYTFNRSDPVHKAGYSAVLHLTETRSVCVRYTVDAAGRSICAQRGNETVLRDVHRDGNLRLQRVMDDAPSPNGG